LHARNKQLLLDMTYHARTGFRRCGTSLPQLSSGPLGGCCQQSSIIKEENMRTITFAVLTVMLSGCATVFKGYMSEVEIKTYSSDSLHVYLKEGAEVATSYKLQHVSEVDSGFPMAKAVVTHMVDKIDSTAKIIQLRSNRDQALLLKGGATQQQYMAYAKLGAGWFILDLVCGGVPIIVDAITGNWNYFDNIQYQGK
jgi:hypothetical protein